MFGNGRIIFVHNDCVTVLIGVNGTYFSKKTVFSLGLIYAVCIDNNMGSGISKQGF